MLGTKRIGFNRRKLFAFFKQWFAFPLALLALILLVWLFSREELAERALRPSPATASWLTVPYGHLVDQAVITHSGETVGEVLRHLRARDGDHFRGLLQPYLEPHSILCNEQLPTLAAAGAPPLRNIIEHYPPGSARPAWSDIAREGHFQVYYGPDLVRLFLKGSDPGTAFERFRSVVRHPVRDILHSDGLAIERVEIYAFTNDYARTEIRLNLTPQVFSPDELGLDSRAKSLDLDSIEALIDQGVALEAAEVDRQNNLFFYGRRVSGATLADRPLGLPDLAAVYRAIFHHGHNEPYISLDRHEDNRYAKVNFGGLLENTRAGHVILEADKLFKTLSTGLDPNTDRQLKIEIANKVPGFLVEDERSFLKPSAGEGSMQIRYWFYPDHIGTVTDGDMGVVQSYQFFADAERMDVELRLDQAVRDTIDHLNANYMNYAAAVPVYRELGHLGRLFALAIWLRETNIGDRVELDDLLSVILPAFNTSDRTKKMLAVSAAVYPDKVRLAQHNVRGYTRTYNLSRLLDRRPPSANDQEFLRLAEAHYAGLDNTDAYPPEYLGLRASIDRQASSIEASDKQLEALEREIERRRPALIRTSSVEVDRFNAQVDSYNRLLAEHRSLVNRYNTAAEELNRMDITSRIIASVGGGISLNPRSFRQTEMDRHSPLIRTVQEVRNRLQPAGRIAIYGDWVRSSPGHGGARITPLPPQ